MGTAPITPSTIERIVSLHLDMYIEPPKEEENMIQDGG